MAERKYQIEQINKTIESLSLWQKVLLQLPTGGGKTYEFALITQRYIHKENKPVFIFVHREELMNQAARTIEKITGLTVSLVTKDTKKFIISRVYVCMVESTLKRLHLLPEPGLVIIDECHIANFNKVHDTFLEALIIGVSATPVASSKKNPLNKFYNNLVCGPQIKELIKSGYLSQNITRCPSNVVDSTKLSIDRLKGDFDEGKMALEYRLPKHVMNIVKNYGKYCRGQKAVVFNVTIEHSKEVNDCFLFYGHNSRHLDSGSNSRPSCREGFKNEREEILNWFKITEDAILNNVMIATVGFDEPTALNIFLNFSTLSIAKYIQCAGRGSRIVNQEFISDYQKDYPYTLKEKNSFNIIDMGGNAVRFFDWNEDRDWEYIFNNPEKPKEGGVAPVKTCPKCEGLVHASISVCDKQDENGRDCLYEFIKKVVKEQDDEGEMVVITKGIDIDSLIEKTTSKYDMFLFYKLCEPILKNIFENYTDPSDEVIQRGFIKYWELCIEFHRKKMSSKPGELFDIASSAWHIRTAKITYSEYYMKLRKENLINFRDVDEATLEPGLG